MDTTPEHGEPGASTATGVAPLLTVEDGVIVQYCHGDGIGSAKVGERRLKFRRANASPEVALQIGERVRCWVLKSGFIQRLERLA
jgi:hypothetical protein